MYSNATPTLSDKRKPRADQTNKRRKMDHTLGGKDEDDMDVDDDKGKGNVILLVQNVGLDSVILGGVLLTIAFYYID